MSTAENYKRATSEQGQDDLNTRMNGRRHQAIKTWAAISILYSGGETYRQKKIVNFHEQHPRHRRGNNKQPQLSGAGARGTLGVYTKTLHGVAHLGGCSANA